MSVGQLFDVEAIDFGDLGLFFGFAFVVRKIVMPFGDIEPGVGAIVSFVGEHKGGDAGAIGLEGEDEHVGHQAEVIAVVFGDAGGGFGMDFARDGFDAIEAAFDFADRR